MSYREMTDTCIFATATLLVVFDIIIAWLSDGTATISVEMRRLGAKYPEIVFILGALAAHWFWRIRGGE